MDTLKELRAMRRRIRGKGFLRLPKFKLSIAVIICLIVISISVFAVWLLTFQSNLLTARVVSVEAVPYFSVNFTDVDIDTSNESIDKNSTATITNDNDNLEYLVSVTETTTDKGNDDCDPSGDCSTVYYIDGDVVSDGDKVNITGTGATTDIIVSYSCEQWSCPCNYTSQLFFNESKRY